MDEECSRLSQSTDRIEEKENNAYLKDHNELISNKNLYFEEDDRKFIEDECDMCKETKCQIDAQTIVRNTLYMQSDVVSDRTNDKLTMEQNVPDECFKNIQCTEILLENQSSSLQALRRRREKTDMNPDRINVETLETSHKKAETKIKPLRDQDCDSHMIKICPDIHAVSHDVEIISCESKTCTSKNTTRSNSTHSQDISDNAGNVKLKLKAYKVTERYKNNIMERRTRCRKCCCVVS